MDSLYRVNIKHKKQAFRIVAPFVEFALNPPKKVEVEEDDLYRTK